MDFLVTTKAPPEGPTETKGVSPKEKETNTQGSPKEKEKETNERDGNYVYALEINLRQCGTTHPYFTMKFLTGMKKEKEKERMKGF